MKIFDTTEFDNRYTTDNFCHYKMISEKGGYVLFSVNENKMCAHYWLCPGEGRTFLIIHITEDVHDLGLDEEQQIRATSFVIEKMKRANDFANKKMGINPNL